MVSLGSVWSNFGFDSMWNLSDWPYFVNSVWNHPDGMICHKCVCSWLQLHVKTCKPFKKLRLMWMMVIIQVNQLLFLKGKLKVTLRRKVGDFINQSITKILKLWLMWMMIIIRVNQFLFLEGKLKVALWWKEILSIKIQ